MKKRLSIFFIIVLLISIIPFSAYAKKDDDLPKLVDDADLLSSKEEKELSKKLEKISSKQDFDVVIVTVDSLGDYKKAQRFADDYFDFNGYGVGKDDDGILFLISMEYRDWAFSTHGYGIEVFTDAGLDYIIDKIIDDLSNGNYYEAFDKFADLADEFITQANNGKPYDNGNLPKEPLSPVWILISFVGGLIFAFIATGVMKKSLKSVSKQRGARSYLAKTNMSKAANRDVYLYSTVTKTPRPQNNTTTGTTTHRSSSGRTHGGKSGKF